MKRITLSILFVLSLALLASCSNRPDGGGALAPDAPADDVPDLIGTYVINGFDPLGTEYGGHLTITAGGAEGEYHMQWILTGSIQEGIGRLNGNQLEVTWSNVKEATGESYGTAAFTVTVDKELYGTKTVDGHPGVGTEKAYPNK